MKLDAEQFSAIVEATARRTVELMRNQPADSDPWLTRDQAAKYLNYSLRSFDRAREEHAEALKPASEHPLRWSKNLLDVFKLSRGVALHHRAGRKRTAKNSPPPGSSTECATARTS